MIKKIRRFYWHMRDRGKGRQVTVAAMVIVLTITSLTGLAGHSIAQRYHRKVPQNYQEFGTNGGTTTGASIGVESQELSETEDDGEVQSDVPTQTPATMAVDTSGLDTFLGFMSEDSYGQMEKELVQICSDSQCKSAKKLNYQQSADGSFDVKSFILLSDGSIYQCDYNLKSTQYNLTRTAYTEADIAALHEQEVQKEQEQLIKQQQEAKKKLEQQRKVSKKKISKKKNSKQKSGKKKAAKHKSKKRTSGKSKKK